MQVNARVLSIAATTQDKRKLLWIPVNQGNPCFLSSTKLKAGCFFCFQTDASAEVDAFSNTTVTINGLMRKDYQSKKILID